MGKNSLQKDQITKWVYQRVFFKLMTDFRIVGKHLSSNVSLDSYWKYLSDVHSQIPFLI